MCKLNHSIFFFLTYLLFPILSGAQESPDVLCEKLGSSKGICVVLGDPSCEYALELARKSNLLVHVHTVTKKMLHASAGQRDIVWLDNNKLLCYEPLDKAELSRCVTDAGQLGRQAPRGQPGERVGQD